MKKFVKEKKKYSKFSLLFSLNIYQDIACKLPRFHFYLIDLSNLWGHSYFI